MDEALNQILQQIRSCWRFRWWALGVAWALAIVGWIWVISQPDIFEANAKVYVETSAQLEELLDKQIVEADVEAQLERVKETMLADEVLLLKGGRIQQLGTPGELQSRPAHDFVRQFIHTQLRP